MWTIRLIRACNVSSFLFNGIRTILLVVNGIWAFFLFVLFCLGHTRVFVLAYTISNCFYKTKYRKQQLFVYDIGLQTFLFIFYCIGPRTLQGPANERKDIFLQNDYRCGHYYQTTEHNLYNVAVIQWTTSCNKNRMTTRYITFWRVHVTS